MTLKWLPKHKPTLRELPDGRWVAKIHPEDAHLFAECEIIDDLLTDRPSDRFDHHMEHLEGRDIMTTREPKPKPLGLIGPLSWEDIRNIANHPSIGADYKALFGWIAGDVTKEAMLEQNPDLTRIV